MRGLTVLAIFQGIDYHFRMFLMYVPNILHVYNLSVMVVFLFTHNLFGFLPVLFPVWVINHLFLKKL